MKKILFLLLLSVAMYGQVPADATPLENIQITNNTQSTTAEKVNVQENDGTINTKPLSELANYLEFASAVNLPVTGEQGKLYLTKDNNRLYRFNGTFYQELTTDISGKEDIANKQNSLAVDGTNTKYPTVTAVNTLKKYTKEITVGSGGTYETLELLFANEPAGKTLINLIDAEYNCTNPQFVVKTGWIIKGKGYGKKSVHRV